MTRKRWFGGALGTICSVALFVPVSAGADLPSTAKSRIVPFEGMAGVKLGMSKDQALRKWGKPDVCGRDELGTEACSWRRSTPGQDEAAAVSFDGGEVCNVRIRAGYDFGSDEILITRLGSWKTVDGRGLGSDAMEIFEDDGFLNTRHGVTTAFTPGTARAKTRIGFVSIYERGCPRRQ